MTSLRAQRSRERHYRLLSICLAFSTALLLIPPEWVGLPRVREEPREPKTHEIKIVRVPPDTLPPPPPLPDPPPRPEPEPEPELQPEQIEIAELQPMMEVPDIDIPLPQQQEQQVRQLDTRQAVKFQNTMDAPDVSQPKAIPRTQTQQMKIAATTRNTFIDKSAPQVDVATPRPAARQANTPSLKPVSRQLKTGLARASDAPKVNVPTGNTTKPSHNASVAVSGAHSNSRVVYDTNPGDASQVAVATNRASNDPGAAPRIAASGGTKGLKYSSAPAGTPVGPSGTRRSSSSKGLDKLGASLAQKYGLPLVSVNSLGSRSTDAARWNMLLPQLSEMFKNSRSKGSWRGNGITVERDGKNLIIRYPDGVVHVLAPRGDGLVALFVGRGPNSRAVTSKVEEAEHARKALSRYTQGAS